MISLRFLITFVLFLGTVEVPYFHSDSFLAFAPLVVRKDEFYAKLDLRPDAADGLILYSGSTKDFISLALKGGKLEMR